MLQLPVDCLNEIFERLEIQATLHSCLLINRLWCEISVRILWKSIWNYNTLFACLPKESKEILSKNGIFISTQTSKPPLFDYVKFIKSLSIKKVHMKIENLFKDRKPITSIIVMQEIFKMFMNEISLKLLEYYDYISDLKFITYPEATNCLK